MPNIIDTIQLSGSSYDVKDKSATTVVTLTQAEYDSLPSSAKTDTSKMYVISDAQAGDLSQYWTSAQTNSAITQATSGLQETLVSGTNIKTINNTSILGSGNIDVGTNLPISAGTGSNSIVEGAYTTASGNYAHAEGRGSKAEGYSSHAEGSSTIASGYSSHAEGSGSKAEGGYSHAEGDYTVASGQSAHAEGSGSVAMGDSSHAEGEDTIASGYSSHAEGLQTVANNDSEHASGQFNVSNKESDNFGDSGNTLFSVGNGTADNARHNAFEIRQNGDIYLTLNGQDVKLQDILTQLLGS